jgi:hypothetical protein
MGVFNPQAPLMALLAASQGNSQPLASQVPPPDQMPMPGSAQQGAQGVLPPQSPVNGNANVNNVLAINKGLSDSPGIAGPNAALDAQRQKASDIQAQMAAMQVPQTAPHNLLLRILAATTPGRAINNAVYGPGVNQYNTTRQNLADQLDAIKNQSAISDEQLKSGTGLAGTAGNVLYKGAEIGVQQERNANAKIRSDAYAQRVAQESANDLVRQSQGWSRLDQQQQGLRLKQWMDKAIIDVAQQRVSAGMDENSARIQATQDVQAELAQNKFATSHPVLGPLMQSLGLAPQLTSTPAAQTPKVMAKPTAAGSGKPVAKKVLVEGKDF